MGKNKIFFALILASILIFSMSFALASVVLEYPMNNANINQTDISGYNNHGYITGNVSSYSSGVDGKSLFFNNGYITTPHSSSLNISGEFAISAWVYIPSVASCSASGNFPSIVGKLYWSPYKSGYGLSATRYPNNSQCSVVASIGNPANNGSYYGWYMTDWTIPAAIGSWHHYVASYTTTNGSKLSLYVDGQYKTSTSSPAPAVNNKPLFINKHFYGSETNSIIIDQVMVYNNGLSSYEVSNLYDNQRARLYGINITNITYSLNVYINGSGMVTSDVGGINCPGTCSHSYNFGTQVWLNQTALNGSIFDGWIGCNNVVNQRCFVNMTANKTVIANFVFNETLNLLDFQNKRGNWNKFK